MRSKIARTAIVVFSSACGSGSRNLPAKAGAHQLAHGLQIRFRAGKRVTCRAVNHAQAMFQCAEKLRGAAQGGGFGGRKYVLRRFKAARRATISAAGTAAARSTVRLEAMKSMS